MEYVILGAGAAGITGGKDHSEKQILRVNITSAFHRYTGTFPLYAAQIFKP